MNSRLTIILRELRAHVPFTAIGTLTGVGIMVFFLLGHVPTRISETLFWVCHPLHVFLSALTTVAMYCRHGHRHWWRTIGIGYIGAIGIATFSDCLMPFVGEALLDLPNRGVHLGFIEKWWLVNPLALAGIAVGYWWPHTRLTHSGHVLLSTWASLFHITMAFGAEVSSFVTLWVPVFLFLSVWVPCCSSDIVFPLLFAKPGEKHGDDLEDRVTQFLLNGTATNEDSQATEGVDARESSWNDGWTRKALGSRDSQVNADAIGSWRRDPSRERQKSNPRPTLPGHHSK